MRTPPRTSRGASRPRRCAPPDVLRSLFRTPAFLQLLLVNSLVGAVNWMIYGWLPTFLRERFGLTATAAGFAATLLLQLPSLAGILAGGAIADAWSSRQLRARIVLPAGAYLLAGPALAALALTSHLRWALTGLALYGVARGFFDANLMPVIRQTLDERFSATAYGFLNFIGCATGGIMTYAGGLLRDSKISLSWPFLMCAIAILGSGLLLSRLQPKPALIV